MYFLRWLTLIFLLFSFSIFLLNKVFPGILHRYQVTLVSISSGGANDINLAFSDRIIIWDELIKWLLENPLTPLGFQGLSTVGLLGLYAHNMFLQSWVIGGFMGLIAFIILLFVIIAKCVDVCKKSPSPVSFSLLALILGYSLTGLVSDHFLNFFTWNIIFFLLLRQIIEKLNSQEES
ncbi:hypothetical protein CHI08_02340 [Peribacillus simplex]|nr:hypothetical protein CHI08_02340 [Peribacillus simplex]